MANSPLTSEALSCCGGNKYDKKDQCCVDRPGTITGKLTVLKTGPSLQFLQQYCPDRGQTKRNAAGNNEVCYGDEISPEGERIQAVANGEYINFCIDGCSQAQIGAATFYVLGIAGVVDTQNPTGLGDRLGTLPLSTSFYGACRGHDVCYQTCSKEDKSVCDNAMRDSMYSTCENITPDLFATFESLGSGLPRQVLNVRAVCMRNAWAYYQGLVWLGSGAFAERKAQYCECCKS